MNLNIYIYSITRLVKKFEFRGISFEIVLVAISMFREEEDVKRSRFSLPDKLV